MIGPRQDQTRAQERIFGEYQSALIEAGSRSPAVILQEEAMGGDMQDARSPDLLDRGLGRVTTARGISGKAAHVQTRHVTDQATNCDLF